MTNYFFVDIGPALWVVELNLSFVTSLTANSIVFYDILEKQILKKTENRSKNPEKN